MVTGQTLLLGPFPKKTTVTAHLCGLGLTGACEQRITGSLVFGHVDTGGAHVVLKHRHTALLLYDPACGGRRDEREG